MKGIFMVMFTNNNYFMYFLSDVTSDKCRFYVQP